MIGRALFARFDFWSPQFFVNEKKWRLLQFFVLVFDVKHFKIEPKFGSNYCGKNYLTMTKKN